MRTAAEANGTPLGILAAYRSYLQQTDLFARRVDEFGSSEAGSRVARPGHSEHQLGTTIDVTDEGATDVDQAWGATPTGQWVASNAHKFGFLISFPASAQPRTCFDFEPWHLRYVGRELSAAVISSGLTLREYLFAVTVPTASSTTAPAAG
jgi:D-alanyl-D-alanine carboxypeptidase